MADVLGASWVSVEALSSRDSVKLESRDSVKLGSRDSVKLGRRYSVELGSSSLVLTACFFTSLVILGCSSREQTLLNPAVCP